MKDYREQIAVPVLDTRHLERLREIGSSREMEGGSTRIQNHLGFSAGNSGAELTDRAQLQAQRFGAEISVPQRAVRFELEPSQGQDESETKP